MMDQSVKFWDKIAERYSKQPITDEAAYQKKLQVTREYFQPNMEVLELGLFRNIAFILPILRPRQGVPTSGR